MKKIFISWKITASVLGFVAAFMIIGVNFQAFAQRLYNQKTFMMKNIVDENAKMDKPDAFVHQFYNQGTIVNWAGSAFEPTETIREHFFTDSMACDYFGISVSSAGDVNGDSFSDIIVGASLNDAGGTWAGRAYLYFGGQNMDNIVDVILTGESAGCEFGHSVASAGDVNGDGYSDIIIGAWNKDTYTGRAYVYFGGVHMDDCVDVILTGETLDDRFGCSVANVGDVNGDGYSDVIVGAFLNDAIGPETGRAYVYFGGASMDQDVDVILTGEAEGNRFGCSVAGAGDVNGDGFSDIIVGASLNNAGGLMTGRVYLYFGGTRMDESADMILNGEAAGDRFGCSVSGGGDVNGDGYSDVIVGAFLNDAHGLEAGRAYIYFGGAGMDSIADWTLTGQTTDNWFGYSVASVGDVNCDGYSDVIVGAPHNDGGGEWNGQTYVYFGGKEMDNVPEMTFSGETEYDLFGNSVAGAGDINRDGYSDVIVGAPHPVPGKTEPGKAYLYEFQAIMATVEFYPRFLNKKIKFGLIAGFIEMPEPYNVHNIDEGSVKITAIEGEQLSTIIPAKKWPWCFLDHNRNNREELMVVFNRKKLIEALGDRTGCLELTLKGTVEGTSWSGSDTIEVFDWPHPLTLNRNNINIKQLANLALPLDYTLGQNYPNPFNLGTSINYQLPERAHVVIKIFDSMGHEIKTLINENQSAGYYTIQWDGRYNSGNQLVSGIYLYQIKAGSFTCTKKMAVLR